MKRDNGDRILTKSGAIAFAIAMLASASQPAIVAGISHAQPEEDIEEEIDEEIEDELEEDFEDEFDDDLEEGLEEDELEESEFDDDDFEDDELEGPPPDEEFEDDEFEDDELDEDELEEEIEEEDEDHDDDEEADDEGDEDEDNEDDAEGEDEDGEEDEEEEPEDDLEEIEEERDVDASLSLTTELVFVGSDPQQFDVAGGEWLVVSDEDAIAQMEARGFEVRSSEEVALLDQVMVRVTPPPGTDLLDSRQLLLEVVSEDQIDYNHLYQPQARFRRKAGGTQPLAAMPLTQDQRNSATKIGLIDTSVVATNATANANITKRDFVRSRNRRPSEHGTAIANILVGQSPQYQGLMPKAELYAASVFEILPDRGSTASTASLVRALDWMVENKVPIVNMSLTGPQNAILQRAIDRARANKVLVVAAIGNEGPTARPLYPAAYDNVISVTAVDGDNRVFRRANRGQYLDFSAPGVGILHYSTNGEQSTSTGTSIAAPFATVALALSQDEPNSISRTALREVSGNAIDIGQPGRDSVYGFGLIRPPR